MKHHLSTQYTHLLRKVRCDSDQDILEILEGLKCRDPVKVHNKNQDRCFTCGKTGHQFKTCWRNREHNEKTGFRDRSPLPIARETTKSTCDSCGEPGPYKSECPTKSKGRNYKIRCLSDFDRHRLLTIEGKVDGQYCSFILDSGVSISLFPND